MDVNFHGTHIAGSVGANGALKGVAPEAQLCDYRVFDAQGGTTPSVVQSAIVAAADDGCDVINLSLGGAAPYAELVF